MNKLRFIPILMILLAAGLFLSGCKTTLLVHDAVVADIVPILRDYAGTHGYQITYENLRTGAFRLSLGTAYVEGRSETTKSKYVVVTPPPEGTNQPLTAYEDTTWRTVNTPGRYVESSAMVLMTQQGPDVLINIDTNAVAGSSLDDLLDYIQGLGYQIDRK